VLAIQNALKSKSIDRSIDEYGQTLAAVAAFKN
jgi:hypothetical protein